MKSNLLLSIFTFLFLFIIFQSCQDNGVTSSKNKVELTNEEMTRLVLLDTSYVYPEADGHELALNISSKFLNNKDGIMRTISNFISVPSLYRTTGKTLIKTDFAVSKPNTPSLYIANFKDEKGYVVISADKRAHEVLAVVGGGTIDQTAHIGLRIFLENAVKHVDEKVAQLESLRGDKIFNSMVAKLEASLNSKQGDSKPVKDGRVANVPCQQQQKLHVPGQVLSCDPGCTAYTTTTPIATMNVTNYVTAPLLTTLWHQGPPYNNGQPDAGCTSGYVCGVNQKYLAGCVAIAEGQVVAYFNAKKYANWQTIVGKSCSSYTTDESNTVADLAHSIYLDYGIYVKRNCDETGAGFNIGDFQFTNPRGISGRYGLVQGEWRSWNTGDIRNSLANGSPVVIQGTLNLCCFIWCWGCGGGHEWVIDGMRDLGVQTTYRVITTYTGTGCPPDWNSTYTSTSTTATQIHQNWGWGPGRGSGPSDWYAQDCFQSNVPVGRDINFNHANYIVAYITPL
ncbi:MAG: C10 family peptidase [Bacteroidetes bacterium]|nr:C10 family peptidase [Bacteroidota bacterium]MBI3481481.1 C10 family peptidase [Bacteroidota bacterium]